MLEIKAPPVRNPLVIWLAAVTALGSLVGLGMLVFDPSAPADMVLVEKLYVAIGAPCWLLLARRVSMRCERDAIVRCTSFPLVGTVWSRRWELTGFSALSVHTSQHVGAFRVFERHRPALLGERATRLLPAAVSAQEAQKQVRALSALLGLPIEPPVERGVQTKPLLAHLQFSGTVAAPLLLFTAPWWIGQTALDDGSMGSDFHQRSLNAYGLCLPFALIAFVLFLRGAWLYFRPRLFPLLGAGYIFLALVACPYFLERYLYFADFRDAYQVSATAVGHAQRFSSAQTIDRAGLGLKQVRVGLKLSQERWAQEMAFVEAGGSQSRRARVEVEGPLPAGAKRELWVSRQNPERAVLLVQREHTVRDSAIYRDVLWGLSGSALLVFVLIRRRQGRA
jgi:hypothetical protein